MPWFLLVAGILIFALIWVLDRRRQGLSVRPTLRLSGNRQKMSGERRFWYVVALAALNVAVLVGVRAFVGWHPLVAGEFYAPGAGISEVVPNSVYLVDEASERFLEGPEYVYRVTPSTPRVSGQRPEHRAGHGPAAGLARWQLAR